MIVQHRKTGEKKPLYIIFEDGRQYEIDKLCACRRAAASKVGGTGIRYTIRVRGQETFLFEDEDLWFVEAKNLHA
ncbi:MAG: hypothetical protein MJ175_12745 [Clostridia bacterium]|nr:hypothetical protein [Clostridia bacterium]